MESKTGSVLSLVGGILQFIVAGGALILGLVIFIGALIEGNIWVALISGGLAFTWGVISVIVAIFSVKAAKLMRNSSTTTKGGIMALIAGIIGGNLITIIGGILGIVDGNK